MCCDCQGTIIQLLRKIAGQLEDMSDEISGDTGSVTALSEITEEVQSLHNTVSDFVDYLTSIGLTPKGNESSGDCKN